MLSKLQLQEILGLAMARGGDFADIFIEQKKNTSVSMEADKIERIGSGIDLGAGIRVITDDSTAYAYTNDLTPEGLSKAAKVASHAAQGRQKDLTINLVKSQPEFELPIKQRPEQVDIDHKVEIINRANKVARGSDNRVKQVSVGYADLTQNVVIANTEGTYVEDERIRTRLVVNVVAAEGNVIQTGYNSTGGTEGFEIFTHNHPEDVAQEAVNRAILMLSAKPAPAGKMPVVMAGEAGGTMVHEACGHGLEADLVQKQVSVYAGKKGQKVASELITVVDDGTIIGKYGTYRFDDEGVASQKTVLIENGILSEFMYDRLTAMKDNRQSTGNGRRESYADKPIPRMRNTYIAPGKDDAEKIIKSTKSGLLVKKMGGGQVNTTNGDFVFDVAEGYIIKDGQAVTPVRGATLTGNGPEVLSIVDMVGQDLGYTIGVCGKDGQGAPVSDAQPTIHIPQMIVGGTAHGGDGPQIKRIRRI